MIVMKAIIFAGGVGTRLWPLSRKKSPKQFEKIIGEQSTLQLTVERLTPEFKPEDIFIATGTVYKEIVHKQLPKLPVKNIILEPHKKDVGPAVAYAVGYVAKMSNENEPIVILWSDHIVKHQDKFKEIMAAADKLISKHEDKIIFIGQKPRFASENLGWIQYDKTIETVDGIEFKLFGALKYKPERSVAQKYFTSGKHCWNLGYFVTTPKNLLSKFKQFAPEISTHLDTIFSNFGAANFDEVLHKEYAEIPEINFDNAILEQLGSNDAYVVVEDIGWSDVGAWEALKEALEQSKSDTVTLGKVKLENSNDSLVYNYEADKLIVGIDLDEILIINTKDALLVTKKSSVAKVKSMVESFKGTEHEDLT